MKHIFTCFCLFVQLATMHCVTAQTAGLAISRSTVTQMPGQTKPTVVNESIPVQAVTNQRTMSTLAAPCSYTLDFSVTYIKSLICAGAGPISPQYDKNGEVIVEGKVINGYSFYIGSNQDIEICNYKEVPLVLELSDGSGSFANPYLIASKNGFFQLIDAFKISSLPANLPYGTNYKFRFRTADPSLSFNIPESEPFTIGFPNTLTADGVLTANKTAVKLTASAAADGVSYAFSGPGVSAVNGNTASATRPGQYTVAATSSTSACTTIATTTVLGGNSATACRGTSATINLIAAGSPVRYEWYIGVAVGQPLRDGAYYQGTTTASLRVVSVSQSQIYYAKVYYADGSSVVYGPYRVTMLTNCGAREAASVEPGTELRITLMGNPLQGEALRALVTGATGQRLHVELVDQSGRSVRSQVFEAADSAQAVEWSLNNSARGMYLLQAVSGQQRHTAKVVKP